MKSKTKKLFLSLFAFAALSMASCGGSSGGSSDTSSDESGEIDDSSYDDDSSDDDDSDDDDSGDDDSGDDDDDDDPPGEDSGLVINVGDQELTLYTLAEYVPGDESDMKALAKYRTLPTSVYENEIISLGGERKAEYGFGPNGDGTNKNNVVRPAVSDDGTYQVHNEAHNATFWVYEYDGVNYGTLPGYSFWLDGYVSSGEHEDTTLDGAYLLGNFNNFTASTTYKFSVDTKDSNHLYFHTTFNAKDNFKIYDTSKGDEANRWISNATVYENCGYTFNANGDIVVSEAGEYYVNYYVNSTDGNHIELYKVVEPVTPVPVNINLTLGEFFETGKKVYAWAWGNEYGEGELVHASSDAATTTISLDSKADGFLLLTLTATPTDLTAWPTELVDKQSINIVGIEAGNLYYHGLNGEGKGIFNNNSGTEPVNYMDIRRGSEEPIIHELEDYSETEYKLIKVTLAVNDVFSICLDDGGSGVWLKYKDIKDTTDKTVKDKFTSYVHPTDPSDPANGNIQVLVAGDYDFYVSKLPNDNPVVYIANYSVPNHFTYSIGDKTFDLEQTENFVDGDNNVYTQYMAIGVALEPNDVLTFHNNDDVIPAVLQTDESTATKFTQDPTTKAITCTSLGNYSIYLKLRFQDDKVYIGVYTPATDVIYTIGGAHFPLNNDGRHVFAWVWGGSYGTGEWVDATIDSVDPTKVTVQVKSDATAMKLVRVNSSVGTWSSDNNTGDININPSTLEYTVTWY